MRNFSPRKLICLMIPIFGTVSIVGTGFSLWVLVDESKTNLPSLDIPVIAASDSVYGFYDEISLKNTGTYEEAEKGYIFPSSLVFDEGHGTATDMNTGLNFYKRVTFGNINQQAADQQFVNQPYIADNVFIDYYEKQETKTDFNSRGLNLQLSCEVIVTKDLAKAISIMDKFPNINGKDYVEGQDFVYTFDFTQLCEEPVNNVKLPSRISTTEKGNFILHKYNLDLSTIFKYRDEKWKPTTTQAYRNLLNLVFKINDGLPQFVTTENISFNLKATYK